MGNKNNQADLLWLGPGGDLEIVELSLEETMSRPHLLKLEVKTQTKDLVFKDMINMDARVVLLAGPKLADRKHYSGVITSFKRSRTSFGNIPTATPKYYFYHIEIRPRLALLEKNFRSKVHQNKTVEEIVCEILGEHNVCFDWKAKGPFLTREYCLQYQETDLNYVQRLLEDEGIYYFYDHENGDGDSQ